MEQTLDKTEIGLEKNPLIRYSARIPEQEIHIISAEIYMFYLNITCISFRKKRSLPLEGENMKPRRHHSERIPLFSQFYFGLIIFLAISGISAAATTVFAQSWYIKPSAEIPVRRGQGTEYRILVVLENGTEVSILEENSPWAKIQTQNGTEGWILRRYLSDQTPPDILVKELLTKNAAIKEQERLISDQLALTTANNTKLDAELTTCVTDLNKTKNDYQFLEEETADVMAIKKNLTISEKKVEELSTKLTTVTKENDILKRGNQTRWFLAGAGTLILGWLVGLISARSKKKRSSLY